MAKLEKDMTEAGNDPKKKKLAQQLEAIWKERNDKMKKLKESQEIAEREKIASQAVKKEMEEQRQKRKLQQQRDESAKLAKRLEEAAAGDAYVNFYDPDSVVNFLMRRGHRAHVPFECISHLALPFKIDHVWPPFVF